MCTCIFISEAQLKKDDVLPIHDIDVRGDFASLEQQNCEDPASSPEVRKIH